MTASFVPSGVICFVFEYMLFIFSCQRRFDFIHFGSLHIVLSTPAICVFVRVTLRVAVRILVSLFCMHVTVAIIVVLSICLSFSLFRCLYLRGLSLNI